MSIVHYSPKCSQKQKDDLWFSKEIFFMEFYIFSWSVDALMLSLLPIRSSNIILIDRDREQIKNNRKWKK